MRISVAELIGKTVAHSTAQARNQAVVIGIAVIRRQLKKRMRATQVQVRIWEDDVRIGPGKACDQTLVGVPQTVHLMTEVSNIYSFEHRVRRYLKLRPD